MTETTDKLGHPIHWHTERLRAAAEEAAQEAAQGVAEARAKRESLEPPTQAPGGPQDG